MRPPPVVRITNGTFFRRQPAAKDHHPNPPLFPDLTFKLPSARKYVEHWCIIGPSLSGKTTFLQLLRGKHLCFPPTARTYPWLSSERRPKRLRIPSRAIQYVGFDAESSSTGLGQNLGTSAYLAARYESLRENTDFSLRDFLLGNTQLNPFRDPDDEDSIDPALFSKVVDDLNLSQLLDLPVAFLSNGQGRRARIGRALLTSPEVLLLDEPFMGLDPPTVATLSPLLQSLAEKSSPRLVLSARPQDPLPEWISHIAYLRTNCSIWAMGRRQQVLEKLQEYVASVQSNAIVEDKTVPVHSASQVGRSPASYGILENPTSARSGFPTATEPGLDGKEPAEKEPIVEMNNCQVKYGEKIVLGNWNQPTPEGASSGLTWTVYRGQRWGVFGPNGSGKTTLVSLLCSDHPQTYSLPIKLFGSSRIPEPGQKVLTYWDIQARIGHSSPEIHQHMPRNLTIWQVVASAWADTFKSTPKMNDEALQRVQAILRWFEAELNPSHRAKSSNGDSDLKWSHDYIFGELSFSSQRVALFARAVVKSPDIIVLDEAFSGMDDRVRDRCLLFLEHGESRDVVDDKAEGTRAIESAVAKAGKVVVGGLDQNQALICISHVREEIPDCVRQWMCLPEAHSGKPARFGSLQKSLRVDETGWQEIWGLRQPNI